MRTVQHATGVAAAPAAVATTASTVAAGHTACETALAAHAAFATVCPRASVPAAASALPQSRVLAGARKPHLP